jgi:transcriptional regulator with XRE-family HTH domain
MLSADQRRLLGEFIRAHRERAQPAESSSRRRTPGLRREELAAKAGISATWCAWIEQGRPVQASSEALGRLSRALSLSRAERDYLFELAGRSHPDIRPDPDVPTSLLAAVTAVRHPAYGLDRLWDACCWNKPAARLFRGWLNGDHQRNLLRFVFLESSARKLIPRWEDRARHILAEFRADYARNFRDGRVRSFVDSLRRASPLFDAAWNEHDVRHREGGPRIFNHPDEGRRHFIQHTFIPSERPDYKLVLLVPTAGSPSSLTSK